MIAVADAATVEQTVRRLAPSGAGVAARKIDAGLVAELSAHENAVVKSARPVRQEEFATGRFCAHRALAAIGADVEAIGRGARQEPIWPTGVTGSITHAGGVAAAVVSRVGPAVAAVGLDVEQVACLEPELWPHVLTPSEHDRCRDSVHPATAATAVFSAKEAAFKALFPMWGAEIDFLDAQTEYAGDTWRVEIPDLEASVVVRQAASGPLVVSLTIVTSAERTRLHRSSSATREQPLPRTQSGVP